MSQRGMEGCHTLGRKAIFRAGCDAQNDAGGRTILSQYKKHGRSFEHAAEN